MRRKTSQTTVGSGLGKNNTKKKWVPQKHSQKLVRAVCEAIENRVMLNASLKASIPASVNPALISQTLLGPGNIAFTLTNSSTTTASTQSFRFAVNNTTAGELTQFSTVEASGGSPADAAIALYDGSGNLLTIQDADPSSTLANETLNTALSNGQQYEVVFYERKLSNTTAQQITLNINPTPQGIGSTIALNPTFGTGTLTTSSPTDSFTSSASVRYFPISFLDGGTSGSIQIAAAGPDSSVDATLYQLPTNQILGFGQVPSWKQITTGTTAPGGSTTLTVTPPSGSDVTDGSYVLVVAPLNFTAAPEPITITTSVSNLLSPSAANPATVVGAIPQTLTGVGTVGGTVSGSIASSAAKLYSVTAPLTGTLFVNYQPNTYNPLLAVYGPGGTSLLAVSSAISGGASASATFAAVAGQTYYISAGVDAQAGVNDTFTLSTSMQYTPTPIAVTSTVGQTTGLTVSPSASANFFQLTPVAGSSYVALQIAPTAGVTVQATVIGPNQTAQTTTASGAGQPLTVIINEQANYGPYDVMISSTSGTGTATFKYVALTVPQQLTIGQLPSLPYNLVTGGVSLAPANVSTGTLTGAQYYVPATSGAPTTSSTYSATASSGSAAILLHYVQVGSVLKLADSAVSSVGGTASASSPAVTQTLHAIAALPINFSGTGTVALSVTGPLPTGIGLAFVPNALPGVSEPVGFQYQSSINLLGVKLTSSSEIDLYTTQLPNNLTSTSATLTFTPQDLGGPLHVNFSVLNGGNAVIASGSNTTGQPLAINLTGLTPNETLRFEITPVPGSNLGGGGYGLSLTVNTSDPTKYLVTQGSFLPFSASPVAGNNYFPSTMTTLPYGTTGVTSTFTSNVPYNPNGTGSIQVFQIPQGAIPFRQPFQVTINDVDPNANANFALFYQDPNSSANPNPYIPLPGTSVNFDYFPGDRSQIDARIVDINVDNTPYLVLGEFAYATVPVYAVVMNEQGSLGQFHISVSDAPAPAVTGPGTGVPAHVLPFTSTSYADLSPQTVQETTNSEVFQIRTPVDLGTNAIASIVIAGGFAGQSYVASISTPPHGIIAGQTVNAFVGTFNASGGANILIENNTNGLPIGFMSAGSIYNLTVTTTSGSFPSGGLTLGDLTIGRTTTGPLASPTPTNFPLDAGFNNSVSRIDPGPDGSFSDTISIVGTSATAAFSVSTAGPVVLHLQFPSTNNTTFGLYQSGQHNNGSGGSFNYATDAVLLDSQNALDANSLYTINANLLPGTYVLVGLSATSFTKFQFAHVSFTGTLPAFQANVLSVNPTTGNNTVAEETTVNINTYNSGGSATGDFPFYDYRYNTNFFTFTAPANVSGAPISVFLADTASNVPLAAQNQYGNINVTIWRFLNGVYTYVTGAFPAIRDSGSAPFTSGAIVTATGDVPVPGAVYYIGIDMNGYEMPAYIGLEVPIITSGLPDFSVQPVTLTADNGKTLITSSINNASYTGSPAGAYLLQEGSVSSSRLLFPLAPFGTYPISLDYTPGGISDVVSVTADPTNVIQELSETNNTQSTALISVDPKTPTATIRLTDTAMTAESAAAASAGGGTWGRYISGVSGQTATVEVSASDNLGFKLYQVRLVGPPNNNGPSVFFVGNTFTIATDNAVLDANIDFGSLNPTSASNLNNISFSAIDVFGLAATVQPEHLDVIATPSFLKGGIPTPGNPGASGTITFNHTSHQFTYTFQDAIVNYANTVSGLLGTSLPVIGDEPVSMLVAINGTGTGGLTPSLNVPINVNGQLTIVAIAQKLIDKTYTPTDSGDHFTFKAQMTLNGATLLPGAITASLQVSNVSLLNIKSPLIPIFSLGIPGVASVDIGLKYALSASLNAGVKVGTDPASFSNPLDYLSSFGVMSPTFVEPSITGTATVAGQVDVAGFDIASLSGSVGLTITMAIGLDNSNPDAIFKPLDAIQNLAIDVSAKLNVSIAASLPIIGNIWSYNYNADLGNIVNTISHGIFLTDPPSTATGKFIPPGGSPGALPNAQDPGIVPVSGTSLDTGYVVDPSPQLVIDNSIANGKALSVQLVNVGTALAPIANLSVATRTSGVWSGASTISQGTDVSDPQLSLTHDGASTPGVVVYDVDKVAGSPTGQTINGRLDNEEIAYRYYNGTTWGSESALTSDSLYDSQPHIAFNASGAGVLAFVHNTDSAPMSTGGVLDANANDLQVSIWNPATHTFGAPVSIGTAGDGVSDSSPSAFVDPSGNKYIVWIRGTGNTNQLMYSTSAAGSSSWSAPAVLGIAGLPAGGSFNNVTLGSDGSGRIDVAFSYTTANADGSLSTTLFDRPTTLANFTTNASIIQVASNANFSGLKSTGAPSGAMVLYWQQSDGQLNQIYEATVLNGVVSGPFQASDNSNLATSPTLAIDGNNKLQLLYDNKIPYGGTAQSQTITDPQVGSPLASGVMSSSVDPTLAQLTFLQGLSFPTLSGGVAPTGSTLAGSAVISNRGQVPTSVTVTAFNGVPGSGGTAIAGSAQTFTLQPGASLNVSQNFTVLSGLNTYSLQLTSPGGQAFDTVETISSTTLTGGLDLAATQLSNDVSNPLAGTAQTLQAIIQNRSSVATGPFNVTLYQGDPLKSQSTAIALSTQTVNSLAGNGSTSLFFGIVLPSTATDDVYTVYVDSANTITETNETNNYARYEVDFRGDPAIAANASTGAAGVTATQVNTGNSNNVQVSVNVTDLLGTTLVNVPIDLQYSRNGGPLVSLGQIVLATLNPGDNQTATFNVTALAGDDVFVATIDSAAFAQDVNPSNNLGSAELQVQGLPTLGATLSLSSAASVAGTPLTLNATVNNTGLADGTSVPLTVLASLTSGGPNVVIGTGTTSVIGLSSQAVQIALNTSGLAPGLYTITLEIDPNHTVLQGSDAGNLVTISEILLVPNLDVLNGTSAIDGITLIQDQDHTHIDWTLNGSSGGQMLITDAAGLTINGNGLNDTVFLDYTNGNPLPNKLNLSGIFTLNNLATTGNPLAGTTIDIERSKVFINYGAPANDPIAAIKGYLATGYNAGAWNGTSANGVITSSAARASFTSGAKATTIGYADSADGTGVNSTTNTVELMYTLYADADLSGQVNANDLQILLNNFNQPSNIWTKGDFDFSGSVNANDLQKLLNNFNITLTTQAPLPLDPTLSASTVPLAPVTSATTSAQTTSSSNVVTLSASSVTTDDVKPKKVKARSKTHR